MKKTFFETFGFKRTKILVLIFVGFLLGLAFVKLYFVSNDNRRIKRHYPYHIKDGVVYCLDTKTELNPKTSKFNFTKDSELYKKSSKSMIINMSCDYDNPNPFYDNCSFPHYLNMYAMDDESVYFGATKYPEIDTGSFLHVSYMVSLDKNGIYYFGKKLPGTSGFNSTPNYYSNNNDIYITDFNNKFIGFRLPKDFIKKDIEKTIKTAKEKGWSIMEGTFDRNCYVKDDEKSTDDYILFYQYF